MIEPRLEPKAHLPRIPSCLPIDFFYFLGTLSIIHRISTFYCETRLENNVHEAGCSGPVHWDDPGGRDGEGGGREAQDGEHVYTHGWFMWMDGKNHHNIVK